MRDDFLCPFKVLGVELEWDLQNKMKWVHLFIVLDYRLREIQKVTYLGVVIASIPMLQEATPTTKREVTPTTLEITQNTK